MKSKLDMKSLVKVVSSQLLDLSMKENVSYWIRMHKSKKDVLSQYNLLSDMNDLTGVIYMYLVELLNSKSEKFFSYIQKKVFPLEALKFTLHQLSEMCRVSLWVYNSDTHFTYSPESKSCRDIPVLISLLPDGTCCSRVPNLEDSTQSNKPKPGGSRDKEDWAKLISYEMKKDAQNEGANADSEASDIEESVCSSREASPSPSAFPREMFSVAPSISTSKAITDLEQSMEGHTLNFAEKYRLGYVILESLILNYQKFAQNVNSKADRCEGLCSNCCLLRMKRDIKAPRGKKIGILSGANASMIKKKSPSQKK
jgi:hypothetical protein